MSKLSQLNSHLFAQLERLNNPELTGEALKEETERGKTMASLSKEVINNARLAFDVAKEYDDMSLNAKKHVDANLLESK
tara:strand:- start:27 stop:263 length:237 start_codon:yes stop_codon:yes gene_type:complete